MSTFSKQSEAIQKKKIYIYIYIYCSEIVQKDAAINSSFNFKSKHHGYPTKIYNARCIGFLNKKFKKEYDIFSMVCDTLSLLELNIHNDFEEKLH